MTLSPYDRCLRALDKAKSTGLQCEVRVNPERGEALVPSETRPDLLHRVSLVFRKRLPLVADCSCEAVGVCVHQMAVALHLYAREGGWTMELASEPPADALIGALLPRLRVPVVLEERAA